MIEKSRLDEVICRKILNVYFSFFYLIIQNVAENENLSRKYMTLLAAISEAWSKGYQMTDEGLISLLLALADVPKELRGSSAYGYLRSKKPKSIKIALCVLMRHGYLNRDYDADNDCYFLRLSEKAEAVSLPKLAKKEVKERNAVIFRKIKKEK